MVQSCPCQINRKAIPLTIITFKIVLFLLLYQVAFKSFSQRMCMYVCGAGGGGKTQNVCMKSF